MRGLERIAATAAGLLIAIVCALTATAVSASTGTKNGVTADVKADPNTDPDIDGVSEFSASTADRSSFGAFLITITNGTPSDLNNYRFRATLTTPGAEFADANPVQQLAAQCVRSLDKLSIDCAVGYNGTVSSGKSVSFNVNVKTPTLLQATDVALAWNVRPGEGDASCYICFTETVALDQDALPGGNSAKVASSVPYTGFFLYTGVNNIPKGASDKHTSAANVDPVDGNLVFATISESVDSGPVCLGLSAKFCTHFSVEVTKDGVTKKAEYVPSSSDLSIPDSSSTLAKKLVFTLRFDKTAVQGLNINSVTLTYVPDDPADPYGPRVLDNCPSKSSSYVPTFGGNVDQSTSPCIYSRTALNGKFGKDLQGDWEFVIFALKNGMFAID